jgi:hypothetical protein
VKNVYLWYVAVEGANLAVVSGWSGSEVSVGPGNTVQYVQWTGTLETLGRFLEQ